MDPVVTGSLAALCYTTAACWHFACARRRQPTPRAVLVGIGLVAASLHAASLWPLLLPATGVDLGLYHVASLVALIAVVATLAGAAGLPVLNLFALLYPVSAALVLLSVFGRDSSAPRPMPPGLSSHVLLSILAYAALTLAACQALVLGLQEYLLRNRAGLRVLGLLPPLTSMETLLFRMVAMGLVLLTLALASGFLFLDNLFDQRVVHHTVLSVSAWLVFVVLLWGHYAQGWRGRKAVHWTLGGFALLGLAYFGSKVVIEVILTDG